uniref:Uncharacterized protein n=1 Tax=Meloidogyne incognita TaxID=6306 RepID=A0A914M4F4_MELIC
MVVGLSRLEAGKQRNLTKIQYVSSGCFSGVATRLVIQPLDVVKIRFQLQEEPLYGVNRGKYSGRMLKTMRMIWKEEGFKALWRGHIPGQALSVTYGKNQTWSWIQILLSVSGYIRRVNIRIRLYPSNF